jgi:all-trans-retinol 13,14-reductase
MSFDEFMALYFKNPLADNVSMPLFVTSNSAKTVQKQQSLIILSVAKEEWFKEWSESQVGHRSPEYEDLKERLGKKMIRQAKTLYPDLIIDDFNIGTPLSSLYYIGSMNAYGFDNTVHKMRVSINHDLFRPQTPIQGLYVTGQDTISVGLSAALQSGILTAHAVAGYGHIWHVFPTERSLFTRLSPLH